MGHQWYPCDGYDEVRVPVTPAFDDHFEFRCLTPADCDTVKDLCKQWFPVDYPDAWVQDICSSSRFYTRVASVHGRIIAFLVAEVKPLGHVTKEERGMLAATITGRCKMAYILSLGVSAEFRRRGLASRLLQSLLCDLRTSLYSDCRAVYLHVLTSNSPALRFYERHKFRMHSFLPYFYKIDGKYRDGFLYVYYVNGGRPSRGLLDYVACAAALLYELTPCGLLRHALLGGRRLLAYLLPQSAKRAAETIAYCS